MLVRRQFPPFDAAHDQGFDLVQRLGQGGATGIGEPHFAPGDGRHVGDAVSHRTGADDGDARGEPVHAARDASTIGRARSGWLVQRPSTP